MAIIQVRLYIYIYILQIIDDISFSIDSNYLSVGSINGDISIINVKNYDEEIITLSDVHCDSIAGLSWSNRNMYNIYSISDDLLFASHEI